MVDNKNFFDFVIVGAGPAGLTAGIIASSKGHSVLILEKGAVPGPKPRGETIHQYDLLDEILGQGYVQSISKHETDERLFHSPKNLYQSMTKSSSESFVFEWRDFINKITDKAKQNQIDIRCECEVISPIEADSRCFGVIYKNNNGEKTKVYGNAILACDGYSSSLGTYYGIDYSKINNPTIKCLVKEANIDLDDHSAFELFLLSNGELENFPNFPPCALFMFPRGNREIELGLMIFTSVTLELKEVPMPDENTIWKVWKHVKENYPDFSNFLKGANIYYEDITVIPSSGFVKNYIPKPGIVLIGDSAGFVESSGSSGLYSSMAMGKIWVNLIEEKLTLLKKDHKDKFNFHEQIWQEKNIKEWKKQFKRTEIYKHILRVYKMFLGFILNIFKTMKTAENINENWEQIIAIIRKAKAGDRG
ncbi:MAG: FAD-dependent oxidoreductase [Candidatus Lokiarchaeota archaeon]|nr:FAD-dependent oxidoreductase [Candidatus Lokiarchaeota archaeon]MBD3340208.1 FAD-dependent oxidoreductase [Candidatus Lokiarchaeota archaeon]